MTDKTAQDYIDSPILDMPIVHPDQELGLAIEELAIGCSRCKERLDQDISGKVTMHSSCIELEAGAPCDSCRTITFIHMRFYADRVIGHIDGKWVELTSTREKSLFRRLLEWLFVPHREEDDE